MNRTSILLVSVLPVMTAAVGARSAEVRRLALVGSFEESFVANPRVAGSLLVGLAREPIGAGFDPELITVLLPTLASKVKACVSAASRDGRYSSENLYEVPSGDAGLSVVPYATRFTETLKRYALEDMAVLVRLTGACDDPDEGVLVPASLAADGGSASQPSPAKKGLVAFLNADPARLDVDLLEPPGVHDNPPEAQRSSLGTCSEPVGGSHVAFDAVCRFSIPDDWRAGLATLQIRLRERFAASRRSFRVELKP